MKKETVNLILNVSSVSMLAALSLACLFSHPTKPSGTDATTGVDSQRSNVAAVTDTPVTYTTQTPVSSTLAFVAATDASVEAYPIYSYCKGDAVTEYPEELQAEIWRQYTEFEGTLPPYEDVLALWITESGLDSQASHYNTDGTYDWGIPQLNDMTLAECARRGWYDGDWEAYMNNPEIQVELGLKVLNYYCDACPGGDYPYYRAIRAYQMGEGGLIQAESIGDFGGNDVWREGPDGIWYPGKYGVIKEAEKYLIKQN